MVSAKLVGKGSTCSPFRTISMGLQPSCGDGSDCLNTQPCVKIQGFRKDGCLVCDQHCVTTTEWEFVIVYLSQFATGLRGKFPELCDIWFMNKMLMAMITHTFPKLCGAIYSPRSREMANNIRIYFVSRGRYVNNWINNIFLKVGRTTLWLPLYPVLAYVKISSPL